MKRHDGFRIRTVAMVVFSAAFLFLNLDGYWVGVPPSLSIGPALFATPDESDPHVKLAIRLRPYLGEELTKPWSMGGWMHGWPVMFYTRTAFHGDVIDKSRITSRWPFDSAQVRWVTVKWFLVDIVFFFLVVVGLFFGIPASHKLQFVFSIKSLMAITAGVAIGLAFGVFDTRFFPQLFSLFCVFVAVCIGLWAALWFLAKRCLILLKRLSRHQQNA